MLKARNVLIHLLFVLVLVTTSLALGGSAVQADGPPGPKPAARQVVLRHDPTYNPHRVPAPPPREPDEIGIQAVSFSIDFDNGGGCWFGSFSEWPQAAKNAFNYAANQWSALLDGTVTIDIHACWQSDLPPGVLGGASHDWVHSSNFDNEPIADTWYPTALADQLNGGNSNLGSYDIDTTFSSTFSWYFGTDGDPSSSQVDFVSVVMHEIGHGLGFDGLMSYGFSCGGPNWGCWGFGSGSPGVYDRYTENGSGQALLDTSLFPNPSIALGSQLTSNNLFFDGANARAANGGTPVKIYAPAAWSPGSSYAHLDEIYNGTPNALMTFALSDGESNHHPGPVTLGMFQDAGWTSSSSAPLAPSSLSATGISQTRIDLFWTDNSSNETGFKIERSPNGTSGWTQIDTVGENVTGYSDISLSCGTTAYYRVRAYNVNGDSGYSNTASASTDTCPPPSAPSGLSATAVSQTQINLSWTDNSSDETGFKIERSPNGTSAWFQIGSVSADFTTYNDDDGLGCGTTYHYRVRAYNANGDSGYSNTVDDTTTACTGPAAPSGLTVAGATSDQIDLVWTDNSGDEDGFILWRSPNGVTDWAQIGTVGADVTSFGDTTVVAGSTYFYRVNGFIGAAYSAYSDIVSATAALQVFLPLIVKAWP